MCSMEKSKRNYEMYLEDILLSMSRIAEYIDGYDFVRFKQDYKTVECCNPEFFWNYWQGVEKTA